MRVPEFLRLSVAASLVCAFSALMPGCAPSATGPGDAASGRFIPSPPQAEAALRAVLDAWRQGAPPGAVPATSPAVFVTDTFRKPSEKLIDYRILGEVPSDRKRCFGVALRFEPERAERTRFLVVGIDPLWVFRQEDAENLAHWEHNSASASVATDSPLDIDANPEPPKVSPNNGPATDAAGWREAPP